MPLENAKTRKPSNKKAWLLGLCLLIGGVAFIQFLGRAMEDPNKVPTSCLNPLDGSSYRVVDAVKASLREPSSFEHIETILGPRMSNGSHKIKMRYRARNGFGGMTVGEVTADVDHTTCEATGLIATN